jgi:hypothetical protein
MKRRPGAWGYNWATLSLWDINTGTWSSRLGVGRRADDLALYKKRIVAKSREIKTGSYLVESCKEGCGSESGVLPVMVIFNP